MFFALLAITALVQSIGMGPLNINLIGSSTCAGDQGLVSLEVISIDGNKKGFNLDAQLPWPLDETVKYRTRVDKIQNGQIQEGVFSHGGDYACEDLLKFLGTFWKKLITTAGASEDCPMAEGHYSTENFPFEDKDIDIDTFLYGRFLINLELLKDDEMAVCMVIEFTNNRPGESV